jgi:hypothetical protein
MVILHADARPAAPRSPQISAGSHQITEPPHDDAAAAAPAAAAASAARAVAGWADRVLRYLNNSPEFREAVLLAVVLTPAGADLGPGLLAPGGIPLARRKGSEGGGSGGGGGGGGGAVPRPRQSWQQLGSGAAAADARRPALVVRRLPGVVRVDGCVRAGLAECVERGGLLGTMADRLIPEIAYKIGRAPKYGA